MSTGKVPRYPDPDTAIRELFGPDVTIVARHAVGGGCIAGGARVDLSDGSSCFLKRSASLPSSMFRVEADGLALLRSDHLRVPVPHAAGDGTDGFVLMEWIDPGQRSSGFGERLGSGLALFHRERTQESAGLSFDNYIGSTPQPNGELHSWVEFYRDRRIGYQTELALRHHRLDPDTAADIERLMGRFESLLPETDRKSLLHGDLWGGNVIADSTGSPVMIDPAVYFGHREADVAMTELFGGFPSSFYSAYEETWSLDPGYDDRRDLYNLYHMLNHLNIFGGSYLGSVRSIVSRYR